MNKKETAQFLGLAGALVAAMLLARKKVGAAMGAAVSIRVLDALGNEVPHNSPVELEPGGSYTVEVTVANLSTSGGNPVGAVLTTSVTAIADDTALMPAGLRADTYGPSESLVLTWPLNVPSDFPAASGAISAIVLDPNSNQLAAATLPITIAFAKRPAINGMGDLDDDGYVTQADAEIVTLFMINRFAGWPNPLSDISPLSFWEFYRRADLDCDGNINPYDITAIETFITDGTLPTPVIGSRAAINGMGDLNDDGYVSSVDLGIFRYQLPAYYSLPISVVSPLSEAEFLRRADLNGDGILDNMDFLYISIFINTGELPELPEEIIYAASVHVTI